MLITCFFFLLTEKLRDFFKTLIKKTKSNFTSVYSELDDKLGCFIDRVLRQGSYHLFSVYFREIELVFCAIKKQVSLITTELLKEHITKLNTESIKGKLQNFPNFNIFFRC